MFLQSRKMDYLWLSLRRKITLSFLKTVDAFKFSGDVKPNLF
jgi:hypothetical protein